MFLQSGLKEMEDLYRIFPSVEEGVKMKMRKHFEGLLKEGGVQREIESDRQGRGKNTKC